VATLDEIYQMISFYAGYQRTRMNFKDFLMLVLPADSLLRSLSSRRDNYAIEYPERLSPEVEHKLARLFQAEIDCNHKLEPYRAALVGRYDYNAFTAFRAIDTQGDKAITHENLTAFLRRAGYSIEPDVPALFIRRLDKDQDTQLSYVEFVDGLSPFGSSYESGTSSRYPMTEQKLKYDSSFEAPEPRHALTTAKYDYAEELKESPREVEQHEEPAETRYETPSKSVMQKAEEPREYPKLELSPFKYGMESGVAGAFEEQIRMERQLENYKADLTLDAEFNLIDGFRMLDVDNKTYVTVEEFRSALRELGLTPTTENLLLLFNRYDRDHDGRLKYSDYCVMVCPKNYDYSKLLSNRLPATSRYYASSTFTSRTRVLYRALLETSLEVERQGQELRQRLEKDPYFSAHEAFRCTDLAGKGYVSINAVPTFATHPAPRVLEAEQGPRHRGRALWPL
jgi:Ca2+-binding EF-hand superfamily protein